MANLDAVVAALSRICGEGDASFPAADLFDEGERRLDAQPRVLFGRDRETTAVTVTLPKRRPTQRWSRASWGPGRTAPA